MLCFSMSSGRRLQKCFVFQCPAAGDCKNAWFFNVQRPEIAKTAFLQSIKLQGLTSMLCQVYTHFSCCIMKCEGFARQIYGFGATSKAYQAFRCTHASPHLRNQVEPGRLPSHVHVKPMFFTHPYLATSPEPGGTTLEPGKANRSPSNDFQYFRFMEDKCNHSRNQAEPTLEPGSLMEKGT